VQTALFKATYIGVRNFWGEPSVAFRTWVLSGEIVRSKFSTKTATFKLVEPTTDIVLLNPSANGMFVNLDVGGRARFLMGRMITLKNISAYNVTLRLDPDSISTVLRLDAETGSKTIGARNSIGLVYHATGGYFHYYTV